MSVRPSGRTVIPSTLSLPICTVRIREIAQQTVRISVMSCCIQKLDLCIPRGAAKTFDFEDVETVDFSDATAITFQVWDKQPGAVGATALLDLSVAGGDITLVTDYKYRITIDGPTSLALTAGNWWCETWVTLSTGDPRLVGAGRFEVEETRGQD